MTTEFAAEWRITGQVYPVYCPECSKRLADHLFAGEGMFTCPRCKTRLFFERTDTVDRTVVMK